MADQLRAIGITLRVERTGRTGLLHWRCEARDFDLAVSVVDFLPDPDDYFSQYATGGQGNGGARLLGLG